MVLVSLILVILTLIAAVEILTAKKDVSYKLVWMLVIILLPVLGVAIYYLFGRAGT